MSSVQCEQTGYRLLVIDDDAIVRDSLATHLIDSGFQVLSAASGEQGLAIVAAESADLILCDLRMPGLDGLGVLRQVRADDKDTPFFVISGAGVMSDVIEALRLGATDYIIKPIGDLEVFDHAIHRALNNAKMVRQNRHYRESLEETVALLQKSLAVLREDQHAGRQIQKKILPRKPFQFNGFSIDYHIWPSLYLSGDFVDYFPINDHCFGFYLADVSGHGSSSAFVTVLLKQVTTGLLDGHELTPSRILDAINKALITSELGKHVTAFCGIVDTERCRLTYSAAGHFPYPILANSGETHFIKTRSLPAGLVAEAEYGEQHVDLSGPFTLAIFSDGILEILPELSIEAKEQLLLCAVEQQADSVAAITEHLQVDPPQSPPDDIAVLVLSGNTK